MTLTSDSLVSTKLRPSQARPKVVARPRLTEKLTPDPGRRLTLVSAPAGFGKTTLLVEWSKDRTSGGRLAAWVSLDEGDNDPVRFLSYLVAALRTVDEGIGEGVLAALRSPEPPQIEALAGALINEMHALPGAFDLILDDYHLIDSESIHSIISVLLELLPEGVHLVIASRIDPPPAALQTARAQSDGRARGRRPRLRPGGGRSFLEWSHGAGAIGRGRCDARGAHGRLDRRVAAGGALHARP